MTDQNEDGFDYGEENRVIHDPIFVLETYKGESDHFCSQVIFLNYPPTINVKNNEFSILPSLLCVIQNDDIDLLRSIIDLAIVDAETVLSSLVSIVNVPRTHNLTTNITITIANTNTRLISKASPANKILISLNNV